MNINNVIIRYLLVLLWIYGFIYIFILRVVRKGYCDSHSISEGGGNAHLKVVCQPPLKEKRRRSWSDNPRMHCAKLSKKNPSKMADETRKGG